MTHSSQVSPALPPQPLPPLLMEAADRAGMRDLARLSHSRLDRGTKWSTLASELAGRLDQTSGGYRYRVAVNPDSLAAGHDCLAQLASGIEPGHVISGEVLSQPTKLALMFSGNGSQWPGMGRMLLQEEPRFGAALREVDAYWCRDGSASLFEVMQSGASTDWLTDTANAQPLLFAMQVGIVQVLRADGLQFDACFGHSVGEIAAAWAAGALTLEQAVRVIKVRSRAQAATRGTGKMAALALSETELHAAIEHLGLGQDLEIAGVNCPASVTVAGSPAGLEVLGDAMGAAGGFFQVLDLDYAFHTRCMDPIEAAVIDGLADLAPSPAPLLLASTVSGGLIEGIALGARYWWRNIREPVLFQAATEALLGAGTRIFIEIGPHSVLRRYVTQTLEHAGVVGRAIPTLKRQHDSAASLQLAWLTAWVHGATVHPAGLASGRFQFRP